MNNFILKVLSYLQKTKRKPLFISITLLCAFVIGAASFTDSLGKISLLINSSFEIDAKDISGFWVISETKKTDETYIQLKTLSSKIVGSTTVFFNADAVKHNALPITAAIYDAKLSGKILTFSSKRKYYSWELDHSGEDTIPKRVSRIMTTHYQGEVNGEVVKFFITSEGDGYFDEVIAQKLDTDSAMSYIKDKYKKKYGKSYD